MCCPSEESHPQRNLRTPKIGTLYVQKEIKTKVSQNLTIIHYQNISNPTSTTATKSTGKKKRKINKAKSIIIKSYNDIKYTSKTHSNNRNSKRSFCISSKSNKQKEKSKPTHNHTENLRKKKPRSQRPIDHKSVYFKIFYHKVHNPIPTFTK